MPVHSLLTCRLVSPNSQLRVAEQKDINCALDDERMALRQELERTLAVVEDAAGHAVSLRLMQVVLVTL